MQLSPNRHHRFRFTQVSLFLVAVILTCAGIAGLATQAKAAPVSMTFDNGRISLGGIISDKVILPATPEFPSEDLPLPQRTDIQLNGDLSGNALEFPAGTNTGMQFPYMNFLSPTDSTLKVPFTFRLKPPGLSGTYNSDTGEASLSGTMDIIVIVGLAAMPNPLSPVDTATPPLGLFGRCKLPDVPVTFSTESKSPFTAERFTGGVGVNGALTAGWEDIPQAVAENVDAEQAALCQQLNGIIHGPGGIWLSNGVVDPVPQPVPEKTCADDLRLCPVPTFTEIDRTKLTPKKRQVKPGKKVTLKATVFNSGTADATAVQVRIRSSNKRVKAPKTLTLDVPAGSSASKTFKVKVGKAAKRRAVISIAAEGIASKAILKIIKKKLKKKAPAKG